MSKKLTVAVIGGGAAGFFGAVACAEANRNCHVILLEKARQVLSKVRISGGGRCNVTHACFDPAALINYYPRGGKELRGPFSRFQPRDTIAWFEQRGISLKVEDDGRMFPVTDNSETIIACLLNEVKRLNVDLRTESGVQEWHRENGRFVLTLSTGNKLHCDRLLIATGNSPRVWSWLEKLGHKIIPPVPSLFTFNINTPLNELAGISVPSVHLRINGSNLEQEGALLMTHWGFSGPAVLKLSAWGARYLHDCQYQAVLTVNWLPQITEEALKNTLENCRKICATRLVSAECPIALPKNLWKALLQIAGIPVDLRWSSFSKQQLQQLFHTLRSGTFQIDGKSTYKEEFVTCGGVKLSEINFKTMESRICPKLYFAGEVLDIDGVTGGFNFQNAWTTSWIAGQAMGVDGIPNEIEKLGI